VKKADAAVAGAWRSPAGKVAIVVASIVEEPLTLQVQLDPAAYGFRRGGRVYRVELSARQLVGEFGTGVAPLTINLEGFGAAVLEIEGR
jgi:hypothetical protein